jgi:predicted NAD/FAD-dependent oxidoreductase
MAAIGIIGAGMAGLACARALDGAGHGVVLVDKGGGPGGRMSTRRVATPLGAASFDHGAQYFTARDPGFRRVVEGWIAERVAAPWPAARPEAYVGVPGMDAPVRRMAEGRHVRWGTRAAGIERRGEGWRLFVEPGGPLDVDAVAVALPAEQARDLLARAAPDLAARAAAAPSDPCWTAMFAFREPVAVTQSCWKGGGAIVWAARNSDKPGREGPESWVAQASPDWSRRHLEAGPGEVIGALETELAQLLGAALPPPIAAVAHRWRFARSGAEGSGAVWDPVPRLGLCGDWLIGPRVESAWMSGTALGESMGTWGG